MLSVKATDCGLLAAVFALRFAAIALPGHLLQTDPDGYLRLAQGLVQSGVYGLLDESGTVHASAYRPPLYPTLLAATLWFTGSASLWAIACLHAALATASAALFLKLGRALRIRFAFAACLLSSLDPLLIRQSQLIMTETAATAVGLLSWWLLVWQEQSQATKKFNPISKWLFSIFIGISFGIATLTRPTAIVWFALVLTYTLVRSTPQRIHWIQQAAGLCLGCSLLILPWTVRNVQYFDKPIWATTHGGYTLLLANNPVLYDHFATGAISRDWDEDRFHRLWREQKSQAEKTAVSISINAKEEPLREVLNDQLAQKLAVDTIQKRPWMFAWSVIVRLGWLWTPLPNPRPDSWLKWPITAWYVGLYVFAIAGAVGLGRKNLETNWWIGWLLLISLTLVHAVYWSNIRMRAPALPLLYLLAAYGTDWLMHHRRAARESRI